MGWVVFLECACFVTAVHVKNNMQYQLVPISLVHEIAFCRVYENFYEFMRIADQALQFTSSSKLEAV